VAAATPAATATPATPLPAPTAATPAVSQLPADVSYN
jgi:hypothetical protein